MSNDTLSKEGFFEKAKALNTYKIIKKLDGDLSYASIGDKYHSDILFERGYNINQLVSDGYLEIVPRTFPFENEIVGKNMRSVYTRCPECQSFGINTPLEKTCGNCGYTEGITYYDAETIQNTLDEYAQIKSEQLSRERAEIIGKTLYDKSFEIIDGAFRKQVINLSDLTELFHQEGIDIIPQTEF